MNRKPGQLPTMQVYRGLWREGKLLHLKRLSGEDATGVSGWTPHMQVRRKAGGELLLVLPVTLDETTVVMAGFDVPATLPLGKWPVELAFVDGSGNKRGPYARGEFEVLEPVTVPGAP